VRLDCRPGREGNMLVFAYTVTNQGTADIYVMHAMPSLDPGGDAAHANEQSAVVMFGPDQYAIIGKFVAPLPADRRIVMPALPLARRLAAQESLTARLEIPEPLAETSPYFSDLTLRQYEITPARGVVFTIGFWIAGIDGLAAVPVDYAPDLYSVVTRNTRRSARRAEQRFSTQNPLQLFARTDAFPRSFD
jgi:hypothetical protein